MADIVKEFYIPINVSTVLPFNTPESIILVFQLTSQADTAMEKNITSVNFINKYALNYLFKHTKLVTDAQPTRKPIPQEMYDPQKYGLKPYASPYVKPSNNQPNNVPNYAAAPPKPTTLQVPVRARSHSTSYQPPMFFKTQGNSVTSLPEAIKEEKPLKIQVNKSRQVMKSINSMLELYSTTSKNRGFLFMINNISYTSNNTPRAGAEIDEKNLIELFKQMDFKIDKHTNKKSLVSKMTIKKKFDYLIL